MLSVTEKIRIVNKLSSLFESYDELSFLCKYLENNPEEVKKAVSKIIKGSFVTGDFLSYNYSLVSLIRGDKPIQEKYDEYVEKNSKKGLFSFFSNKKRKKSKKELEKDEKIRHSLRMEVDEDIILSDIEGIRLPSNSEIITMCEENQRTDRIEEEKLQKRIAFYKKHRGFDETAFYYRRDDLLLIDTDFIYESDDLTGKIYEDYRYLYSGERYVGDQSRFSPLNNSFETNLENIRKANDISFKKRGNVYRIENGRHRVIYLIRSGKSVEIPVNIARRIEDKEFNQRLISIGNDYDIDIYKNNILNDDPDILIRYENALYRVVGNEGVKQFEDGLKNNSLDSFESILFEPLVVNPDEKKSCKEKYKMLILKSFIDDGETVVTGNFSDFIKGYGDKFENINGPIILEAYKELQNEYNHSKVFGYDFLKSKRIEFKERFGKSIEEMEEVYK